MGAGSQTLVLCKNKKMLLSEGPSLQSVISISSEKNLYYSCVPRPVMFSHFFSPHLSFCRTTLNFVKSTP